VVDVNNSMWGFSHWLVSATMQPHHLAHNSAIKMYNNNDSVITVLQRPIINRLFTICSSCFSANLYANFNHSKVPYNLVWLGAQH